MCAFNNWGFNFIENTSTSKFISDLTALNVRKYVSVVVRNRASITSPSLINKKIKYYSIGYLNLRQVTSIKPWITVITEMFKDIKFVVLEINLSSKIYHSMKTLS